MVSEQVSAQKELIANPAVHRLKVLRSVLHRIIITHVVTLSSIGDFSIKGPAQLSQVFGFFDAFANGVTVSSVSSRCVFGFGIYAESFGNALLVPVCVAFCALLVFLYGKKKGFDKFDSGLFTGTAVLIMYMKYPSTTASLLTLSSCHGPVEGKYMLSAKMDVPCFDSEHIAALSLSVVLLLAIVVGFPVLIFYISRRHRGVVSFHFEFLFEGYTQEASWWEGFEGDVPDNDCRPVFLATDCHP